MIKPTASKSQTCGDVISFKVRKLFSNLAGSQPTGQKIEDVGNSNPHPSHTGPPATLSRVYRNALN